MKRRTGGKELVLNGWRNRIAKEDGENGEGLAKLREKREIVTTSSSTLCNDNLVHSMGAFCGDKVRRGPSLASNES